MLDHVRHVEAVAMIRRGLEGPPLLPAERAAIEGWLEENHPPPEAYSAAMSSMVEQEEVR